MECFIIMGFDIKTGEDGKEYNLNLSYDKIIKPALDSLEITYVRADELMTTDMIDESMYKLLLCADLVIADITTLNPNALYELGVRYALKPYSTIILSKKGTKLPFDINHLRVFMYEHGGEYISDTEIRRMINLLKKIIEEIQDNVVVDSPVYKFIDNLSPPQYYNDHKYFSKTVERFKAKDNLCNLVNKAYELRDNGKFIEAINLYKKALKISDDVYIVKEIAMCMYQEATFTSYQKALSFIKENIDIENTQNPEVLKCLGTIYKNMWKETNLKEFAECSLKYYEKSFVLFKAYNSGLNYGFMLLVMSTFYLGKEKEKYLLWGKHIYSLVKDICLKEYSISDYWVNATLEECSLALEDNDEYVKYGLIAKHCMELESGNNMTWKREKTIEQLSYIKRIFEI